MSTSKKRKSEYRKMKDAFEWKSSGGPSGSLMSWCSGYPHRDLGSGWSIKTAKAERTKNGTT